MGIASSLLFGLGVFPLFWIGLSCLLPHDFHDTDWIPGRYDWNYPIDALCGLVFWLVGLVAWFRWIRIYDEVRSPETGPADLRPDGDYSLSYLYANLVAMPLTLALFLGPLFLFWWVHPSEFSVERSVDMNLWRLLAAFALSPLLAGVLYVPAVAGTLRALGMPRSSISWGIRWAALSPFVHCSVPMEMRAYRIVLTLPGVLMGLAPAILGLSQGWLLLTTFGASGLAVSALSLHLLWRSRRVSPETMVLDIVGRTGLRALSSEHVPAV